MRAQDLFDKSMKAVEGMATKRQLLTDSLDTLVSALAEATGRPDMDVKPYLRKKEEFFDLAEIKRCLGPLAARPDSIGTQQILLPWLELAEKLKVPTIVTSKGVMEEKEFQYVITKPDEDPTGDGVQLEQVGSKQHTLTEHIVIAAEFMQTKMHEAVLECIKGERKEDCIMPVPALLTLIEETIKGIGGHQDVIWNEQANNALSLADTVHGLYRKRAEAGELFTDRCRRALTERMKIESREADLPYTREALIRMGGLEDWPKSTV